MNSSLPYPINFIFFVLFLFLDFLKEKVKTLTSKVTSSLFTILVENISKSDFSWFFSDIIYFISLYTSK